VSQDDVQIRATPSSAHQRRGPEELHALAGPGEALARAGGPGIRVDSHLYTGYNVPPYYDSLIAKVIASARTATRPSPHAQRAQRDRRRGIKTNVRSTRRSSSTGVRAGGTDIHYLERRLGLK